METFVCWPTSAKVDLYASRKYVNELQRNFSGGYVSERNPRTMLY
jgi:hypothetical protein